MNAPRVYPLAVKAEPIGIFRRIIQEPHVFFLDSSLNTRGARVSYLGYAPFQTMQGRDWRQLRKALRAHAILSRGQFPFSCGAVGYVGYEGQYCFSFYDALIIFDHQTRKISISAPTLSRSKKIIERIVDSEERAARVPSRTTLAYKSNFTQKEYLAAVRKALGHIRRGDIYQINLSHQVQVKWPGQLKAADAAAVYGQLRRHSPSNFGAYYDDGQQYILSASPERFLSLRGRRTLVSPMKGTRPRGTTQALDLKLREDLLTSPKEIAELLMVTDLERNDLGRVCEYGSIKVKTMRAIETYKTVYQATSTVQGRLHPKFDGIDLLKAAFPSGSVTGCPKIAAMQIIQALEHGPRGLYTGALGYIGFNGNMDFSVLIRTLFLNKDRVTFHVGGGIVADSNPQAEWDETWVKAQALQEALKDAL